MEFSFGLWIAQQTQYMYQNEEVGKRKKKNTSKMASLKDFTSHSALLFKKKKKKIWHIKESSSNLLSENPDSRFQTTIFSDFFFLIEISKRTLKGLNSERGRKRKNKLLEVTDMQSADTSGNSLMDS